MPKRTDTYEQAYHACSELFSETSKMPTIASVKERIGVNSPVTIKKAIDDWLIHLAADFIDRHHNPGIPDVLFESISSVWKLALSETEKAYVKKNKKLLEQGKDTEERIKVATQQIQQALQEKEQLIARFEAQEHYISHFKEEHKALQDQQQILQETAKIARQECEQVNNQCINLQAKYDEAKQQWEERYEKEHDWMLRRIQEEKERIEQAYQLEFIKLQSENKNLKLDKVTLETRLTQAQVLADKLLTKNDALSDVITAVQQKLE